MTGPPARRPRTRRSLVEVFFAPSQSTRTGDAALIATRIALVWIFTYYGAGKLFG